MVVTLSTPTPTFQNDYYEYCLYQMRQVIRMLEYRIQLIEEETYGWW